MLCKQHESRPSSTDSNQQVQHSADVLIGLFTTLGAAAVEPEAGPGAGQLPHEAVLAALHLPQPELSADAATVLDFL